MTREERGALELAREILGIARRIESDNGELGLSCYPVLAAAESALHIEILRQIDIFTNSKIQREATEHESA
jgi:hypothetical protein